jgi:hypothetical protein
MRSFRKVHVPNLVENIAHKVSKGSKFWNGYTLTLNLEPLRSGVEMMESIPTPARRKPTQLEQYAAELRKWRRMRTTARKNVAKFSRLVRYHRSLEKQPAVGDQ